MSEHIHRVQIYYEDTDHSGAVYHTNYLEYFERVREHLLGTEKLVGLLRDDGIGFGESIEIRTIVAESSDYRLHFQQNVHRPDDELLVDGEIELVCVDRDNQLVPLPRSVADLL